MFKVQHTPLSFAFALAALLAAGPACRGAGRAHGMAGQRARSLAAPRSARRIASGWRRSWGCTPSATVSRRKSPSASTAASPGARQPGPPGRLLVDGALTIAGSYDDGGEGALIVLGDLSAEHVLTGGALYVQGAVRASGLVFGEGGRDAFETDGGVTARGIVMAGHRAAYAVAAADFVVDDGGEVSDAAVAAMGRRLLPELFAGLAPAAEGGPSGLALLSPSALAARELARSGKPLFRAREAPASLEADLVLAAAAGSGDAALLPLVGRDPLVDRLLATRPGLSRKLTRARIKALAFRSQAHDPRDHRRLFRLDHARAVRFGEHSLDFFIGDDVAGLPDCPRSRRMVRPDMSSSQTSGAARRDKNIIAGATLLATASGARRAICFGTSSPTINDK